ncbi:MAG: hypothetical protein ACKOQM_03820 [Novosphingobium sp.]|jgi:hypothetical protein
MTPLSPRTLRGAIVSFRLPSPVPNVIVFQYNPASLTRTLEVRTAGGGEAAGEEAFRIAGAPNETIKLEIELDGADSEVDDPSGGVQRQLAALEMLIAPPAELVIANTILAQIGTIELIPPQAPFTLFVFGSSRILPVRIAEFGVSEDEFEPGLRPIRAKVSLGLKVLTYSDLPFTHPGYQLSLAAQVAKEAMARVATASSLDAVLGGGQRIL